MAKPRALLSPLPIGYIYSPLSGGNLSLQEHLKSLPPTISHILHGRNDASVALRHSKPLPRIFPRMSEVGSQLKGRNEVRQSKAIDVGIPEDWEFPNTTCRALWFRWYHGDPILNIGPFRRMRRRDLKSLKSRQALTRAKSVMAMFGRIAIENGFVNCVDNISKMDRISSMDLYESVFFIWFHLDKTKSSRQCRQQPYADLMYSTVYASINKRRRLSCV